MILEDGTLIFLIGIAILALIVTPVLNHFLHDKPRIFISLLVGYIVVLIICSVGLPYREVSSHKENVVTESYELIKGNSEKSIHGEADGHGFGSTLGLYTRYEMNINENNEFSCYIKNKDGEIERKKLDFASLTIKEVDKDEARLEYLQEKSTIEWHSLFLGDKQTTETNDKEKPYHLIVPEGTITDDTQFNFE